jgi:hypothetical protein
MDIYIYYRYTHIDTTRDMSSTGCFKFLNQPAVVGISILSGKDCIMDGVDR